MAGGESGVLASNAMAERVDMKNHTVRALSERLSGLSVPHSKSVFYGGFVWTRRVLNR
jgi:hypothetical protein